VRHIIAGVAFATAFLLLGICPADGTYIVTDLGTLGGSQSTGLGLSENGLVVGGSYIAGDSKLHPFLWTQGVMQDLGSLAGFGGQAYATGVNSAGTVIGNSGTSTLGGCCSLGFVYFNGLIDALPLDAATAINEAGLIAGSAHVAPFNQLHAETWDGQSLTDLRTLRNDYDSATSTANAISNLGVVTGYSTIPDARAFVYENGAMSLVDVGAYPLRFSIGYGINDAGDIVGQAGWPNAFTLGFLYSGGQITFLQFAPGSDTAAVDINNLGQIVGNATVHDFDPVRGIYLSSVHSTAFLYDGSTMTDLSQLPELQAAGFSLIHDVAAINDRGQIVGTGAIGRTYHAFLLTPEATSVPEPSTAVLLAVGSVALPFRARKHRTAGFGPQVAQRFP